MDSENTLEQKIIEVLKDQQKIFGDLLFAKFDITIEENIPNEKYESKIKEKMTVAEKFELSHGDNLLLEDYQRATGITELYDTIHNCQNCLLGKTRNKFVFGVGNPEADIMLIGEAPGAEEDKQGIPFVGRAGKLLTDILKAIDFEREDVYIANIVKCRPPQNRNPLPAEVDACIPYLYKQIELIKPKVILCLGLVAASSLFNKKYTLTKMRGNVYDVQGIKTMVTYHPAALLRNPNWKRGCWEDVKKFKQLYIDEVRNQS
ncbi:uracil DNA glycosylase superfamily protein [bacterium BMS3Abin04]|nr:uracil DNA glycosylase superfamily protein [bacterium BMS3Abin04]